MSISNNAWQRRSRLKLVWAVGVFLLVQQVACFLLDYRWPQVRFPWAYERFAAAEANAERSHHADILCLGSSRLLTNLSAEHLEATLAAELDGAAPTVLDATVPGGDAIVMEFMYGELERRGVRPKLVVLEVMPETFQRRNERCRLHLERHWTWSDVPTFYEDLWYNGQVGRFLRCRLLPLYTHRYAIGRAALAAAQVWWTPSDGPDDSQRGGRWAIEDEQAALANAARHYSAARVNEVRDVRSFLRDYQVGGGTTAALDRLVAHCRAQGAEVLLLAVPIASSHRACYGQAIEAEFQGQIRRLIETHGCRFADCRAALPNTLFVDHHHGTPEGALIFSRRLGRETLAPTYHEITAGRDERPVRLFSPVSQKRGGRRP